MKKTKRASKKPKEEVIPEYIQPGIREIDDIDFSQAMDAKLLENASSDYLYTMTPQDIPIDINKIEPVKKEEVKKEKEGIPTTVGPYTTGGAPEDYANHWPEDPNGVLGDLTLEGDKPIPVDQVEGDQKKVPLQEEFSNFDFAINAMYNLQTFAFDTMDSYLYQTGRVKKMALTEKLDKNKAGFLNCYAQIIQQQGDHWVVELLTNPVFLWGTMSMGIVAAHVKENGTRPTQ